MKSSLVPSKHTIRSLVHLLFVLDVAAISSTGVDAGIGTLDVLSSQFFDLLLSALFGFLAGTFVYGGEEELSSIKLAQWVPTIK